MQKMRWFSIVVVAVMLLGASLPFVEADSPRQGAEWPTSTPEEQGMDSATLAALLAYIQAEDLPFRSMLVIRHGVLVTEAYAYPYDAGTSHELRSCTKSVLSALIGIARSQGHFDDLNVPALGYFSDRTIANLDTQKQAVTLKNLLTMTGGFDWPDDESASTNAMTSSSDWVQYVLDQPMIAKPGTRFKYNNGGSHLLAAILQRTLGRDLLDYANEVLFHPLGISSVRWDTDPQQFNIGSWGLYLRPRDMAKLGQLYLDGGQWQGVQIVPADWVAESTRDQLGVGDVGYGYQWWVHSGAGYYAAEGFGGEYIMVAPDLDLVVVFTGVFKNDKRAPGKMLLADYVFPAVRSDNPLPPNPDGMAQLATQIAVMGQPQPEQVYALPEIAGQVSGHTYRLQENPSDWVTMQVIFEAGASEAQLVLNNYLVLPVGLDNLFRMTLSDGDVLALRGTWTDEDRFVIEMQPVGVVEKWQFRMIFEDDLVEVRIRELVQGYLIYFDGIQIN